MAERLTRSGLPRSTSHVSVGAGDARSDLGYGRLSPRFHLPKSLNLSYPYEDPDSYDTDSVEIDSESEMSVGKKSIDYSPVDPLSVNSTDPFYFVGGNTKLSDCFWRTEKVLEEIASFGDSMSPIPQMNARKGPSLSGYSSSAPYQGAGGTNYRRTGTLQGWSKSPPPLAIADEEDLDSLDKEGDTYSLEDMSKKHPFDVGFLGFHDT